MSTEVRALTLHQPWASLVAVGAKRIETRSWATKYRGRLLIHAAVRPIRDTPRERGSIGGGYSVRLIGRYGSALDCPDGGSAGMPLGAVVASAVLTDCVPMVKRWGQPMQHASTGRVLTIGRDGELLLVTPGEMPVWRDVSAEMPFGDFTPGRFAWLLDDVKPTTERCPRCIGDGHLVEPPSHSVWTDAFDGSGVCLWGIEFGEACERCPTCGGLGSCDPVPMRGRQGLWRVAW